MSSPRQASDDPGSQYTIELGLSETSIYSQWLETRELFTGNGHRADGAFIQTWLLRAVRFGGRDGAPLKTALHLL